MKRALLLTVVLALALVTSGCNGSEGGGTTAGTDTDGGTRADSGSTIPDGLEPMPADSGAEAKALAAAQTIFVQQRDSGTWKDVDWAANEAAGPLFTAYIVAVNLDSQVALFEIRADGVA